jgi:hypothetical protein
MLYKDGALNRLVLLLISASLYVQRGHDVDNVLHAGAIPSKLITEGSDGNISISYGAEGIFLQLFLDRMN